MSIRSLEESAMAGQAEDGASGDNPLFSAPLIDRCPTCKEPYVSMDKGTYDAKCKNGHTWKAAEPIKPPDINPRSEPQTFCQTCRLEYSALNHVLAWLGNRCWLGHPS